jgi:hypothetical protein
VIDETLQLDAQKGILEMKKSIVKGMFRSTLPHGRMINGLPQNSLRHKREFPPTLKPPLAKLSLLAIRLDAYDDDFFSFMLQLFPYNRFTMTVCWSSCVLIPDLPLSCRNP